VEFSIVEQRTSMQVEASFKKSEMATLLERSSTLSGGALVRAASPSSGSDAWARQMRASRHVLPPPRPRGHARRRRPLVYMPPRHLSPPSPCHARTALVSAATKIGSPTPTSPQSAHQLPTARPRRKKVARFLRRRAAFQFQ
jgi:hypothetical protein